MLQKTNNKVLTTCVSLIFRRQANSSMNASLHSCPLGLEFFLSVNKRIAVVSTTLLDNTGLTQNKPKVRRNR